MPSAELAAINFITSFDDDFRDNADMDTSDFDLIPGNKKDAQKSAVGLSTKPSTLSKMKNDTLPILWLRIARR